MKGIIRNIIIIAVVLILGVVGYEMFFANKTAAPAGGLQTTAGVGAGTSGAPQVATAAAGTQGAAAAGADFVSLLLSVKSITLDDSIFSSQAFTTLQDFNRPIPPDTNPGRPNPFAPIGSDGTASATQISTSNPSSVTATTATFNGTLTVSDPTATRWFEYGTSNTFGMMTTPIAQTTPGAFADTAAKLTANTTYFVRADAMIGGTTVYGNTLTWKTALAAKK